MAHLEKCPNCGALTAPSSGPRHEYFGASAGCWQVYGQILAKEYNDPRYMAVHRLTVDAYAVQHPGNPEPRSIQSMNVHLLALYLVLEKKLSYAFATQQIGKCVEKKKNQFFWLEPPCRSYPITVADVALANSADEHRVLVENWARETWKCWKIHHVAIDQLAQEIL